ncbi:MAG: permease [Deltaproteobacteria bacterium]|nr:permease [Deltaproteobacteria bacterium]MBW2214573.1 permease [Deltaproteobacteria bacterium]MBW2380729.1 permease [Deltaproteobacteria bacterium]MBW2686280.1 permease [Deltaproteobacteria bacterium]
MLDAVWQVWLQLSPWLLLGAAAAGLLHVLLPRDFARRQFRGLGGVGKAVALGVPLPLCSCGVIPAGLGLKKDGASDGAAIGFLISTPQTGVDSLLVSASFLGWPFTIFKALSALVMGLAGGAATEALHTDAEGIAGLEEATAPQSTIGFFEHMVDVIRPIWKWIVFGVVASAAITVWIPPGAIAGWSNLHPALVGLAALAIALPLYVCATASVPIAAALIAQGMPTGAALVFLMAGPATNIATIGAVKRAFGGRVLAVYLATVVIGSVGLAYLYDAFIPFEAIGSLTHEHGHPWWAWAAALLLAGLFVYFVLDDLRSAWLRRTAPAGPAVVTLEVEGLTCNNCVRKLERALRDADGVTSAMVTLDPSQATVEGSAGPADIEAVVRAAGYAVK